MILLELVKRMSPLQRYAVLVVVVVIAVALYLFFSGQFSGGGDDGDGQADVAQAEPVEPVSPGSQAGSQGGAPVVFGESGRVGLIDYAVDDVSYPTQVPGASAAERFGLVRLRAVNRGDSPVLLGPEMIQIVSADGHSFAADAELSLSAAEVVAGAVAPPTTLQPGLAMNVVVVFQLPNSAGGLSLRLHGAWVDFALDDD